MDPKRVGFFIDQCNLWTLDRVDIFPICNVFFFVRKASSIAVPKMTLQEIVKQKSELKCYCICYIDMLESGMSSVPELSVEKLFRTGSCRRLDTFYLIGVC